jgi:F0F1-type ATP synthase gamma subunit
MGEVYYVYLEHCRNEMEQKLRAMQQAAKEYSEACEEYELTLHRYLRQPGRKVSA